MAVQASSGMAVIAAAAEAGALPAVTVDPLLRGVDAGEGQDVRADPPKDAGPGQRLLAGARAFAVWGG
jgi:hypothetical protein